MEDGGWWLGKIDWNYKGPEDTRLILVIFESCQHMTIPKPLKYFSEKVPIRELKFRIEVFLMK